MNFDALAFDFQGGALLVFRCGQGATFPLDPTAKPATRKLIVNHEIRVVRLPDRTPIPSLSARLSTDRGSWAWSLDLELAGPDGIALLQPTDGEPARVEIALDGVTWTALVESWQENRAFGELRYTAQGRSTAALLAAPYAAPRSRTETETKTAAQLLDVELENTGWEMAYHPDLLNLLTTTWSIPAGVRSYQNQTRIEACLSVAQAIGARLYADRNATILYLEPRYPVSPWQWAAATPDAVLPLTLVRQSATRLQPKPDYNQVIVSGLHAGVTVSAKRQGSAGDKPAPMRTDPLITHPDTGRELARNVLADVGRQAVITLDVSLNATTGLIAPGLLLEVGDTPPWRGLVVGCSLTARLGLIMQTIEVERHYA